MARRLNPQPRHDDTTSDYVQSDMESPRWVAKTLTVVTGLCLLAGGVLWAVRPHGTTASRQEIAEIPAPPDVKPPEQPTPTQEGTTDWVDQVVANAPMPILPDDQAQLWRTAFQEMADCMHTHGIKGFPDAPETFGDGKTAAPAIGILVDTGDGPPTSEQFGKALAACPFDSSMLDRDAFAVSNAEWLERSGQAGTPAG